MRVTDALARRVRMLVSRAVVNLVDDARKVQSMQLSVLDGEVADAQRFQEYGFTSVPLAGAEALVAAVSGVRSHRVVVAVEDGRYRLKSLQPGEVALYDNSGNVVHLQNGQIIAITAKTEVHVTAPTCTVTASDSVTIDTPTATFTGDVSIDGTLATQGDITTQTQVTAQVEVTAAGITLTSRAEA